MSEKKSLLGSSVNNAEKLTSVCVKLFGEHSSICVIPERHNKLTSILGGCNIRTSVNDGVIRCQAPGICWYWAGILMGGCILHSSYAGQVHLQLENLTNCSVSGMRSVDYPHMVRIATILAYTKSSI